MTEETTDEVQVDPDNLINELLSRLREEGERSSDASESAALVKEFLEETNLNARAFQVGKQILKQLPKKQGQIKAMDIIRSLNVILPMLENHVQSQGNVEMDLGEPGDTLDEDELDAIDEESEEFAEAVDALDDDDNVVTAFGG